MVRSVITSLLTVRRSAPPYGSHQLARVRCLAGRWQAGRSDEVAESDRLREPYEGEVVGERGGVPVRVGPAVVGGDLHPVWLRAGPHVVGSGPDIKGPRTEREERLSCFCCHTGPQETGDRTEDRLNLLLSTVAGR